MTQSEVASLRSRVAGHTDHRRPAWLMGPCPCGEKGPPTFPAGPRTLDRLICRACGEPWDRNRTGAADPPFG